MMCFKALFSLKKTLEMFLDVKLFNQIIKPILCYVSELRGDCDVRKRKHHTGDGLTDT